METEIEHDRQDDQRDRPSTVVFVSASRMADL